MMPKHKRAFERQAASTSALRARMLWILRHRKLPEDDPALRGRLNTFKVGDFAKRHNINFDWLLVGDLPGLLDTVKRHRTGEAHPVIRDAQTQEFVRLMGKVDPRLYPELLARIRAVVEGGA